jgi:8-hydroxy-5-deazaflavin:NADPH oxidoreductase
LTQAATQHKDGDMKIAVLGFGNVGSQMAKLWVKASHDVVIGLRDMSKDTAAAQQVAAVKPPAEAAADAGIIALALPWQSIESVLADCGSLSGKIIVDASNPLDASLNVLVPPAGSAAEQIALWATGAKVVKAFNTIGAALYGDSAFDNFYCGDDPEAKETVRALIADTSAEPVDVGGLANARYLEQLAGLWIALAMKGFAGGAFAFNIVRKENA